MDDEYDFEVDQTALFRRDASAAALSTVKDLASTLELFNYSVDDRIER
jgi:hypothetical protein